MLTAVQTDPTGFQSTLPARGSDRSAPRYASAGVCFNPRSPRGGATWMDVNAELKRLFQSTLPARGSDSKPAARRAKANSFNPRSPRGGATDWQRELERAAKVSIHAPREGERRAKRPQGCVFLAGFNPRSPRGGATSITRRNTPPASSSFNPRSPRGGATYLAHDVCYRVLVSIHAPREGERRRSASVQAASRMFQSTLPARGSDLMPADGVEGGVAVSIHAPREGERLMSWSHFDRLLTVSIHAPREGERLADNSRIASGATVSIHAPREGERPALCSGCLGFVAVSIHAPREGERRFADVAAAFAWVFQSTLPARGSDAGRSGISASTGGFQSTLPARGSDPAAACIPDCAILFQSTLPARGSDRLLWASCTSSTRFNPRSPRGGATHRIKYISRHNHVSIHAPREGERPKIPAYTPGQRRFQSTLPARGSDGEHKIKKIEEISFNPRSPRGGATQSYRLRWPH